MAAAHDRWKREIDLAAYAVRVFGFVVNRAKSSRRQQVLHRPASDEVIVVGRDARDGHWWYFNPQDPADKGTIIDFVLRRRGGDWAAVEAELGGVAGEVGAQAVAEPGFVLPALVPLQDRRFLASRGLPPATLDAPAFAGRIFNETLSGPAGTFTYTVFPLYDRAGQVVGLERRNTGFKAQAAHSRRGEGLWMSQWAVPPAAVLVTESPLDALAYHTLYPDAGRAYLSTCGALAEGQMALLGHWFEALAPARFLLGADADPPGQAQNLRLAAALPGPGRATRYEGRLYRQRTGWRLRLYVRHAPGERLWLDAARQLLGGGETAPGPEGSFLDLDLPAEPDALEAATRQVIALRGLEARLSVARPRLKDWNAVLMG